MTLRLLLLHHLVVLPASGHVSPRLQLESLAVQLDRRTTTSPSDRFRRSSRVQAEMYQDNLCLILLLFLLLVSDPADDVNHRQTQQSIPQAGSRSPMTPTFQHALIQLARPSSPRRFLTYRILSAEILQTSTSHLCPPIPTHNSRAGCQTLINKGAHQRIRYCPSQIQRKETFLIEERNLMCRQLINLFVIILANKLVKLTLTFVSVNSSLYLIYFNLSIACISILISMTRSLYSSSVDSLLLIVR